MTNRIVRQVHFEDFEGVEFERLVFAYHVRIDWVDLAWHGRTGSDLGRDIIGKEILDNGVARIAVIQCVNRSVLTLAKVEQDIERTAAAPTGLPEAFKFVCRSDVSSRMRDKIVGAGQKRGIRHVTIWSGAEFEEHLRLKGEYLLRRFVEGVVFPDDEGGIRRFVDDFPSLSDDEALELISALFERPAFQTPFRDESSIPGFLRAIEDTIMALNTGIWRTRDGTEIRRIPSLHNLRDLSIRSAVQSIARDVDELRRLLVKGLRDGSVRPCGCGQVDCPVIFFHGDVDRVLDAVRVRILNAFGQVYPKLNVKLR